MSPDQPLRLTERTTLELDGFGSVDVLPGGSDMAQRRSRLRAAEEALRAALADAGAADPADAERQADARRAAEAEAAEAERRSQGVLAAVGFATPGDLDDRIEILGDLARGAVGSEAVGPGEDEAALERAETALAEARVLLDAARRVTHGSDRSLDEARRDLALVAQERSVEVERVTVQTRLLDEGLASRTDEDLEAALTEVAEARLADLGERATCERSRAHVEPETTRAQLEVAGRALEAALDEGRQLDRDIAVVEGELRGVGDEGVGERLAAAEVRLEAARQHLERVRREAGAWKLLYEELSAAATATREALLAPVVARLTPWLGRLLPGVEPVLDPDTLAPIELRRGSRTEALTHLSHGTREQIAVLVRLGLAQLLNEREGEAPCIILDDALVYADENRFDTMKAIIQVAAADLQIIILTCRPRDYRGLTGRHVRLEECRG